MCGCELSPGPLGAERGLLHGYRLVDYLTQGYLAVVGLIILLFHGDRLPLWPFDLAQDMAQAAH